MENHLQISLFCQAALQWADPSAVPVSAIDLRWAGARIGWHVVAAIDAGHSTWWMLSRSAASFHTPL